MSQVIHSVYHEKKASSVREKEKFALDILVGLSRERKSIPSLYHYDPKGSELFQQITHLEEYYLSRCEEDVLVKNSERLAEQIAGQPFNLIEFGSGDGLKSELIIKPLLAAGAKFRYVPIDVSKSILDELVENFGERHPTLEVNGLVANYFEGLKWMASRYSERNVVIFLGSNIGNFDRAQARLFLRNLWMNLSDADLLLIGFDLKKEIDLLLNAYNDTEEVTAAFNLNLLTRINRELGGHFNEEQFQFHGTYDVFSGAIESYLVSRVEQEVFIEELGRSFHFDEWEPIHTEYSYKYLESDIKSLACDTGFEVIDHLYDTKRYFVDSLWQVRKATSAKDQI